MTKYRKGPTKDRKGPAKDHKGPTKDPQTTAKEHYTGPQRIGNHERTARLATILFDLKKIVFFVNFGVLVNYGGL